MPQIKFRFTTECEMTLIGSSYEEIYLKFKDMCHGDQMVAKQNDVRIFPPEDCKIFFEVDDQKEYSQIDMLKGDFKKDIVSNSPAAIADKIVSQPCH